MTILSAVPEKITRIWAVEFEQIYAAMSGFFPTIKGQPPLTVMLFENKEQFRDYTPMNNGQAKDVAGYFTRMSDRAHVALNVADTKDETRRVVYHEAVHWFFSAATNARPVWLEEGLADLFSTLRVKQDEFLFGENIENHLMLLQTGASLNIKQVLGVTPQSPEYNESSRAGRFYATAWVFLHYVVCGQKSGGFPSLGRFLLAVDEGMPQAEAFRQSFGGDYAQLDQELYRYVTKGKYQIFRRKFDRASLDQSLKPSALTADELNLEIASLLVVAQRLDQARPLLEELAVRLPDSVRVLEARGLLAVQEKDPEAAREHYGRALELGSKSYYCHLGPAMAELAFRQERGAALGRLAPGIARRVLDGINQTILTEPTREEFYQMMPALLVNAEPLSSLDGRLIMQGAKLFPANLDLELGCAIFCNQQGRKSEALARFERIRDSSRELPEATRTNARNMALNIRNEWAYHKQKERLEAGDYEGAIAAVDERIALAPGSREAGQLQRHRVELENMRDFNQTAELIKNGKEGEARAVLTRLAGEAIVPLIKLQAGARLKELAVRKADGETP